MLYNNILDNKNKIIQDYKSSMDISFRELNFKNNNLLLVYNQSLCDNSAINDFILKALSYITSNDIKVKTKDIFDFLKNFLPVDSVKKLDSFEKVYESLSNGFACLFFEELKISLAFEVKALPSRSVSEPLTEQSISGPKDAFNENIMVNIGLIRKRIKTNHLIVSEKNVGKQTKTRLAIMYMDNIAQDDLVKKVNDKLDNIDIDGILDVSYIKQIICDKKTMFPVLETTERPDSACINLLEGRILILCDNSPFALIIPTFFIDLFHASEDDYQSPIHVGITRGIRIIAFILAVIIPAFYIAITTFNQEAIPVNLFISFAQQRSGVPFPAIIEALLMVLIFEILRESDIRMPHLAGSSISILGAIVLGDAAVAAGIVSPIMVIVIAVSAICSLIFSHIGMINAVRFWRVIFMIFATFFGIAGIFICAVLMITILAEIESLGKPYLYPAAPFSLKFFVKNIFRQKLKNQNQRSPLLTDKNYRRNNL